MTRFYVPLLLQAFSQSLTYPLVAGVVSHGSMGVNALTAFCQGQLVMFLIGALGGGLLMTGMVFAKTKKGYLEFRRLNACMMVALLVVQCIPVMPPVCDWVFKGIFALPSETANIARWTLLGGVIMNAAFFLRNVPMVVLFNRLESGKANLATIYRMVCTLAAAMIFPRYGLVGASWGLVALTGGCIIELLVTWAYARPYVRELPGDGGGAHISLFEQLRFTLPLSLGGFLLMVSPLILAAFVGRTANAADMLAIHYVTIGVTNPVSYAALRMQAVAIEFPPEYPNDRRLGWFALVAGAVLGLIPLGFSFEPLSSWYFGAYQNVPERLLPTVRLAIGIYSLICMIHALRGRLDGLAAINKRPRTVMFGQFAYTLGIVFALMVTMLLGVSGWLMALLAIFTAPIFAMITLYCALSKRFKPEKV